MKLTYDAVAAAVHMADLDPDEVIRPEYTGRFARSGFGLSVEMVGDALKILLYLSENGVDVQNLADRLNMDGMGHNTLVYFPGVLLDGAPEEEDYDEEDDEDD